MKCYQCDHYDNKTGICDCDGKVVISPGSDAECDYLKEPPTVFEKIIASQETLADKLVYDWGHLNHNGDVKIYWKSTILPDAVFYGKAEAVAATLKKLEEVG